MGTNLSKKRDTDQTDGAKLEQDETVQISNGSKPEGDKTVQNMKTTEAMQETKGSDPHKLDEILKKVDNPILGGLKDQVRTGIFLDQKKKKFWVDENGHNCFMLFARDLTIVWGEDERYWRWVSENEISNTQVEVAELKQICWLEVRGKFELSLLTPNSTYQVFFIIKLKNLNFGWSSKPAKLQLKLPNGEVQNCQERLNEKPKEQWIQIKAGEFETREAEWGDIEIGFFEWDHPYWKGGLLIKGIMICPK